tara:strand:+ start:164 stop:388 length:225 start_codon:yes stop_codon:yes gene_type:complete
MILSFITQSILEITSGIICWTAKKGYNTIYYILYKDEYISIEKKEYDKLLDNMNNKDLKIFELENIIYKNQNTI